MSFKKRSSAMGVLFVALAVVALSAAGAGAYYISPLRIPAILATHSDGYEVLIHVRLPRVLLGLITGASLAVAGCAMQGMFRNPLADPGLIGITAGAGFGAALWIVVMSGLFQAGVWGLSFAAFVGAAVVTILAWQMASGRRQINTTLLLLAGIGLNSLAGAGIGVLTYLSDEEQLQSLTFWLLGGLGGATWPVVGATAAVSAIGMAMLLPMGRPLNLLCLGESDAWHLGVNTHRVHRRVVIGAALTVGAAVSAAGGIGFVGLVVPHLIRLVMGPDHRFLLPASVLLGASLVTASDLFARTAVAPAEIPVGVITALIGAPFFLWLVWRQRKEVFSA